MTKIYMVASTAKAVSGSEAKAPASAPPAAEPT